MAGTRYFDPNEPPPLTDEEIEADHREWLRTHGYQVPPMATQEEIDTWGLDQWEDPEEET